MQLVRQRAKKLLHQEFSSSPRHRWTELCASPVDCERALVGERSVAAVCAELNAAATTERIGIAIALDNEAIGVVAPTDRDISPIAAD